MLNVVRHGAHTLGPAADPARAFIRRCHLPSGAFRGRSAAPDLYYTGFGLDLALALGGNELIPATSDWIAGIPTASLDFMDLVSFIRCATHLPPPRAPSPDRHSLAARLEAHRAENGGYHPTPRAKTGTASATFLTLCAFLDLGLPAPPATPIMNALRELSTRDGAYANAPGMDKGTTQATAATLAIGRLLGQPDDLFAAQWMLDQWHPAGGFLSSPDAPIPDLLSTATALFAAELLTLDLTEIIRPCRAYILALQRPDGGFAGVAGETDSDCEYTFYALLALGCLTPPTPSP